MICVSPVVLLCITDCQMGVAKAAILATLCKALEKVLQILSQRPGNIKQKTKGIARSYPDEHAIPPLPAETL